MIEETTRYEIKLGLVLGQDLRGKTFNEIAAYGRRNDEKPYVILKDSKLPSINQDGTVQGRKEFFECVPKDAKYKGHSLGEVAVYEI